MYIRAYLLHGAATSPFVLLQAPTRSIGAHPHLALAFYINYFQRVFDIYHSTVAHSRILQLKIYVDLSAESLFGIPPGEAIDALARARTQQTNEIYSTLP